MSIMTLTFNDYYMNEEGFILYLLKLRKNDQKQLLNHFIKYNEYNFSFTYELLYDFIFNLEKKEIKKEIY